MFNNHGTNRMICCKNWRVPLNFGFYSKKKNIFILFRCRKFPPQFVIFARKAFIGFYFNSLLYQVNHLVPDQTCKKSMIIQKWYKYTSHINNEIVCNAIIFLRKTDNDKNELSNKGSNIVEMTKLHFVYLCARKTSRGKDRNTHKIRNGKKCVITKSTNNCKQYYYIHYFLLSSSSYLRASFKLLFVITYYHFYFVVCIWAVSLYLVCDFTKTEHFLFFFLPEPKQNENGESMKSKTKNNIIEIVV